MVNKELSYPGEDEGRKDFFPIFKIFSNSLENPEKEREVHSKTSHFMFKR